MLGPKKSGQNFYKTSGNDEDDLLSEISTPDLDINSERRKIMEALERRQRDREEIELEDTFKSLLGSAQGVDKDQIEMYA